MADLSGTGTKRPPEIADVHVIRVTFAAVTSGDTYTFADAGANIVDAEFIPTTAVACGRTLSGKTVTILTASSPVAGTLRGYIRP